MTHVNYLGVVTSPEHEPALRKILEKETSNVSWIVGDENPDLADILVTFEKQAASVVIVDEAGLPYFEEVSAPELPQHAIRFANSPMKLIFIASPQRTKEDSYLASLIDANLTCIVCPYYFENNFDGIKEDIHYLIHNPIDASTAQTRLEGYPEPQIQKRGLLGAFRKQEQVEITDILASRYHGVDSVNFGGEKISEEEWFASEEVKKVSLGEGELEAPAPAEIELPPIPEPSKETSFVPEPAEMTGTTPVEPTSVAQTGAVVMPAQPQKADHLSLRISEMTENDLNELADLVAERIEVRDRAKAEINKRRSQQITYGVSGNCHGVGVTHFALSSALCLAQENKDKKVICLLSNKKELNSLALLPQVSKTEDDKIMYRDVEFRYLGLSGWPIDGDIIVCDCNVFNPDLDLTNGDASHTAAMFATAKHKIMILGGTEYANTLELMRIVEKLNADDIKSIIWAFFGASRSFRSVFFDAIKSKNILHLPCHQVLYDDSYLAISPKSPVYMRILNILNNVIPPKANKANPKKGQTNDNTK